MEEHLLGSGRPSVSTSPGLDWEMYLALVYCRVLRTDGWKRAYEHFLSEILKYATLDELMILRAGDDQDVTH